MIFFGGKYSKMKIWFEICEKSRDIYYAKYYGKGGGGIWPAGEKNEIRS